LNGGENVYKSQKCESKPQLLLPYEVISIVSDSKFRSGFVLDLQSLGALVEVALLESILGGCFSLGRPKISFIPLASTTCSFAKIPSAVNLERRDDPGWQGV